MNVHTKSFRIIYVFFNLMIICIYVFINILNTAGKCAKCRPIHFNLLKVIETLRENAVFKKDNYTLLNFNFIEVRLRHFLCHLSY
jgi:hypothetical protein